MDTQYLAVLTFNFAYPTTHTCSIFYTSLATAPPQGCFACRLLTLPGCVRPALPARCVAATRDTGTTSKLSMPLDAT
jgi:hypothetical protein